MAPQSAKRPPTPTRPNPLQRVAELAGRAVSPDRMRREVEAMVAGLLSGAGEDGRIQVRERLEELAGQLAEGVEAAQEATADLDSSDRIGLRQAEAAVVVLRAAHDAFKAAQAAIQ